MIHGRVSARREAIIPVRIREAGGHAVDLEATIDTGFSGYLTLPDAVIASLQLLYDRTEIYTLGDNRDEAFDLYVGTVIWDGQDRDIFVLSSDSNPLVGMSLLHGHDVFIEVVVGGEVRIEARP